MVVKTMDYPLVAFWQTCNILIYFTIFVLVRK